MYLSNIKYRPTLTLHGAYVSHFIYFYDGSPVMIETASGNNDSLMQYNKDNLLAAVFIKRKIAATKKYREVKVVEHSRKEFSDILHKLIHEHTSPENKHFWRV